MPREQETRANEWTLHHRPVNDWAGFISERAIYIYICILLTSGLTMHRFRLGKRNADVEIAADRSLDR